MHEEPQTLNEPASEVREAFTGLGESIERTTKKLASIFQSVPYTPTATTKKRGAGYTRPRRNKHRLKRMRLKKMRYK